MKRIISIILSIALLFSITPAAFAADFSDFNSSHWAYEYVNTLVSEGTINGYTDGTFRPEGTVTRAEFVKMIGEGSEIREQPFDDVTSGHWAYKYIMSSGLKPLSDNMFAPDTPITRGDVAELLWARAGKPMGITAPPVVHRQGKNFDAISWVYTNGIMVGDDYINLRLGDTLTRAEASALIIRSKNVSGVTKTTNFYESVNSGVFEEIYNAYKLCDRPYTADGTLTNGEVAMAAARLMSGEDVATYKNVNADKTFEHLYAQPINMLCHYYLGMENDNAAYADKNATIKEAIAALMFATSRSANVYIPMGTDAVYPQYKLSENAKFDTLIKNAYHNGIYLEQLQNFNLDKEITMKEFVALVMEFDGFSGFHRIDIVSKSGIKTKNAKIRYDFETYPTNKADYRIVINQVANKIYETPFKTTAALPKDSYELGNSYRTIVTSMLSTWVRLLSSAGYELEVTYYPGLVVNNGNGYTLRVSIKIVSVPQNYKLGDLINCVNDADGATLVNNGDVFFADIDTGKKLNGLTMDINDMVLSQIVIK
ncbi:MAG: S-layer homology domain-containing protein [Clostridia bacterium]|nr:S-layer homology domain-containing protein [Clostridia bacterium]